LLTISPIICTKGQEICTDNRVPFEILTPLISETAQKIMLLSPQDAQTGPAKRNDDTLLTRGF
jgi:hypothetical protein